MLTLILARNIYFPTPNYLPQKKIIFLREELKKEHVKKSYRDKYLLPVQVPDSEIDNLLTLGRGGREDGWKKSGTVYTCLLAVTTSFLPLPLPFCVPPHFLPSLSSFSPFCLSHPFLANITLVYHCLMSGGKPNIKSSGRSITCNMNSVLCINFSHSSALANPWSSYSRTISPIMLFSYMFVN